MLWLEYHNRKEVRSIELDVRTLVIILIAGHIVMNLLLTADLVSKKSTLGDKLFLLGKFIQLMGWITISQRGQWPEWLSLFGANGLLLCGSALESIAMTALKRSLTKGLWLVYGGLLSVV